MFKVEYIDGKVYVVYGVRTDTFLIRQNGLWRWVYMHDCKPVDEGFTVNINPGSFRRTHDD